MIFVNLFFCYDGVKLSQVSNCPRCQIVLGVKLSHNQIFYNKYVNSKIILTPDGNNGTTLQSTPFSPILFIMNTCMYVGDT